MTSSRYSSKDVRDWLEYLTEGEYSALKGVAKGLDSGATVINIGAGGGTSGLLFVETLMDRGYVYTVDIQDEPSPFGCLPGERAVFKRAKLAYLLNSHWFQIHGDSVAVGKEWGEWGGAAVDLLFIDGDHSYAGCAGDIFSWYNHVKVGGYIAIHDYDPNHWVKKKVHAATNDILLPIMEIAQVVDCMIVLKKTSSKYLAEGTGSNYESR